MNRGFTLIELLVVVAVIGILAALLIPAATRGKQKAQGIQCLCNERQLSLAWRMDAEDNGDRLSHSVASIAPQELEWLPNPWSWSNMDNTIKASPLWHYCKSPDVWTCPANRVVTDGPLSGTPACHSFAMNEYFGARTGVDVNGNLYEDEYVNLRIYRKLSDLSVPGPSILFLFVDNRIGSFGGMFHTWMSGWPDNPSGYWIGNEPMSFSHSGAASFAFADGHSEARRWKDPRSTPGIFYGASASPSNSDVGWLQWRSTRPKN
jgi:prepilin-type N-terminal cleavage/methylation domain-containing protein/prepilin-type processing-associated H-X9-DG protein